jgi:hypothetical protein
MLRSLKDVPGRNYQESPVYGPLFDQMWVL